MKYLIISDIHGSYPCLEQALAFFHQQHCDMLCVLGDILNYGPRNRIPEGIDPQSIAKTLNAMSDEIIAVRGNCDSEVDQMLLDFPIMAEYAIIVDEGKKLFLTHGHIYNEAQLPKGRFDAIFYGHTHLWMLKPSNGSAICNTGSITFPKQQNPPTMVIYDQGTISVYTLEGKLLSKLHC